MVATAEGIGAVIERAYGAALDTIEEHRCYHHGARRGDLHFNIKVSGAYWHPALRRYVDAGITTDEDIWQRVEDAAAWELETFIEGYEGRELWFTVRTAPHNRRTWFTCGRSGGWLQVPGPGESYCDDWAEKARVIKVARQIATFAAAVEDVRSHFSEYVHDYENGPLADAVAEWRDALAAKIERDATEEISEQDQY